jgi:hypothetical protein
LAEPEYQHSRLPKTGGSMDRIIVAGIALVVAGIATTAIILFWPKGWGSAGINPESFKDGIGIYMLNNNQYSLLTWKKRLINPRGEEKDIVDAAKTAIPVHKTVRFFSYGIDYSKSLVVPPYIMAFCVVRDVKTVDGIFPIRIKPLNPNNYELLLRAACSRLGQGSAMGDQLSVFLQRRLDVQIPLAERALRPRRLAGCRRRAALWRGARGPCGRGRRLGLRRLQAADGTDGVGPVLDVRAGGGRGMSRSKRQIHVT